MKLSEAIRLGSMLKPQCTRRLWRDGGSCAMGAAADAIGKTADAIGDSGVPTIWPHSWPIDWGLEVVSSCPACSYLGGSRYVTITHLNDDHRWTREQIADWVETTEQQQEASPAPLSVAVEA